MSETYSSLSLSTHLSPSRGPALIERRGIAARVFFVASSTILTIKLPNHTSLIDRRGFLSH